MSRARFRTERDCAKAGLWPDVDPATTLIERRLAAVEEVLCSLPDSAWSQLIERAGSLCWYLPCPLLLGQVLPVAPSTGSKQPRVIYLSPLLEQQDLAWSITTAAHELAHVVLGHRLGLLDAETNAQQEAEAQTAIRQWGFQPEASRMLADLTSATPFA